MKKTLLLGAALTVAFSVNVGLTAFAEGQTDCLGDTTGQTDCVSAGGSEEKTTESSANISTDVTTLSFGHITEVGRSYTKNITIKNNTAEAMTVRVEATDFNSDTKTSAKKWVAFVGGKRKFDIRANGSVQVGVRILVPNETKGGTYYAKVKISNGKEADDAYVTVRADIANDGYKYGGEIVAQNVGFFNMGDKISASAKLKNDGTAGFTAHYLVQYKNAFGLSEWTQIVDEERDVIPGGEEEFNVDESDKAVAGYGIFTVEQKISYVDAEGKQKEAVLSHAVVNLPWWSFAILGGAIVLIIVIVVVVKVRRKNAEKTEKASKKSKKKSVTIEVEEDE